jgi:hypothetical protein
MTRCDLKHHGSHFHVGIAEQIAAGEDANTNLSCADHVEEGSLPPGESRFLVGGVRLTG